MDHKLKLVDYSDTEPEESETVPVTQQEPPPMRDSQGRQVAVVGPTPQHVAVVHPMEAGGGDEEDLNGTGIFEADENDPLSTQATQGSITTQTWSAVVPDSHDIFSEFLFFWNKLNKFIWSIKNEWQMSVLLFGRPWLLRKPVSWSEFVRPLRRLSFLKV